LAPPLQEFETPARDDSNHGVSMPLVLGGISSKNKNKRKKEKRKTLEEKE
jgi:hypothetical protein